MAGASLRCAAIGVTLDLPYWPTDVTRTPSARQVQELERPGRVTLAIPAGLTTEDVTLGFTLRQSDWRQSVAGWVSSLERLAATKKPVQVVLGERVLGLFRLDPPTITEQMHAANGDPSVVDVSLVLKRASDAMINVGLARRIRGTATGVSRQR